MKPHNAYNALNAIIDDNDFNNKFNLILREARDKFIVELAKTETIVNEHFQLNETEKELVKKSIVDRNSDTFADAITSLYRRMVKVCDNPEIQFPHKTMQQVKHQVEQYRFTIAFYDGIWKMII